MIKNISIILFTISIFSTTIDCVYNNQFKQFNVKKNSLSISEQQHQKTIKYVINNINNLNPVDDYVEISNKKYNIIYPLNCNINQ